MIDNLRKEGDSIGAKIEVTVSNMPIGLGEPVFDKLEADLAKGLMSINAVKGFEIGKGFGHSLKVQMLEMKCLQKVTCRIIQEGFLEV